MAKTSTRCPVIDTANILASTADPVSAVMRVVAAAERRTAIGEGAKREPAAWGVFADHLDALTAKLRKNDLTSVEDMLFGQAVALQSLFVRLSEGALQAETIPNYDLKFRYALRAQSQCRATLETLANIKNPPSVMFARQANLANGPQQINNGVPALARADGSDSKQIEQSEAQHELRQDTRTPALTLGDDQAMAPVGPVDGTANSARQGDVIAKRLEGRQATGPSRPRANAARPATAA